MFFKFLRMNVAKVDDPIFSTILVKTSNAHPIFRNQIKLNLSASRFNSFFIQYQVLQDQISIKFLLRLY